MTALDRWKAAGLVEVGLPSGFRIRLVPPTPATLVLLDLAPTIVDEVLDARAAGKDDEEAAASMGHSALDVALRYVREIWDDQAQAWEPVQLTGADVVRGAFPPADVEALMAAALSGLEATEGPVGIDDLRPFRDGAEGDGDREDGGAVRPASKRAGGPRSSAARARTRRGAGGAPLPR